MSRRVTGWIAFGVGVVSVGSLSVVAFLGTLADAWIDSYWGDSVFDEFLAVGFFTGLTAVPLAVAALTGSSSRRLGAIAFAFTLPALALLGIWILFKTGDGGRGVVS
jgi:hypothetical protein